MSSQSHTLASSQAIKMSCPPSLVLLVVLCAAATLQSIQAQSASLDVSTNPLVVSESDGRAEICVVVSPVLTTGQNGTVQVIARSRDSATNNVDYIELGDVVTFGPGEERQCIDLVIIEDSVEEGDTAEFLRAFLVNPGGDITGTSLDVLIINIVDSTELEVSFTQSVVEVMEGRSGEVCVFFPSGTIARGVDVGVRISTLHDPDAEVSFDTSIVTFTSDTTGPACFTVNVIQDAVIEDEESFTLVLESGSSVEIDTQGANMTLVVVDNDFATLALNETSFSVMEGDLMRENGTVTQGTTNRMVCVILVDDLSGLLRDIVINVNTQEEDATNAVDFIELNSTITIPSGSPSLFQSCVVFSVLGDDQREENETFRIVFTPQFDDFFLNDEDTVTVTIQEEGDSFDCRTLTNPDNGDVEQDGNNIGATAAYSCDENFILVPEESEIRECRPGDWNGTDPICLANCSPLLLDNGQVVLPEGEGTLIGEGTVATYQCNFNFALMGAERRVCQANGTWSETDPVCAAISCDPLDGIRNGGVRHDGFNVGDIATYSCRRGFELVGESLRVCMRDKVWSGEEPQCELAAAQTPTPTLSGTSSPATSNTPTLMPFAGLIIIAFCCVN